MSSTGQWAIERRCKQNKIEFYFQLRVKVDINMIFFFFLSKEMQVSWIPVFEGMSHRFTPKAKV